MKPPPSSSVSSLSSRREAKRTRRYVMLLAFVSFLAPLVYHQNHESHPQTKRGESRISTFAHHHFSSLHDQHRTSIAKSYGHVGQIEDDDEDDVIAHNNRNDEGSSSLSSSSSPSNCNKRGIVVNNKCQCLKLWRGRTCEEGPNIFSFKSKSSEKLPSSRKVDIPLQFEGDFTTNKEQLRKTCEDGNIKVFLPGKVPPMRVIGTCKSVEQAGVPLKDVVSKKPYKSCAVVGNSGMLAYGQNGKEIDSHDVVIRFNGAPTKGLENRVGTKTSFRLVNSKWLDFRESKDEVILWNMRGAGALEDYIKRRAEKGKDEKFYLLSSSFVNYVGEMAYQLSNSFDNLPGGFNAGDYTPTSGWTGLILAVNVCTEVKLYGMQISEAQGVPYHYHNRCPQPYGERDQAEWLMFQRFARHKLASFKEPCIEECHTDNPDDCKRCMSERSDFYGEEATKEGRIAWEKSPMPHYCLGVYKQSLFQTAIVIKMVKKLLVVAGIASATANWCGPDGARTLLEPGETCKCGVGKEVSPMHKPLPACCGGLGDCDGGIACMAKDGTHGRLIADDQSDFKCLAPSSDVAV